jgi:adenylosuccinate synthase
MAREKSDAMGIQEFGTVTQRQRRIGQWDGEMARYSAMINGCTQAAITGIDRVDKACARTDRIQQAYEDSKGFPEAGGRRYRVPDHAHLDRP